MEENKSNMGIKVLLVNPPITTYGSDSPPNAFVPLGLAYIAAVLEKENYDVQIVDALALGETKQGEGFVHVGLSNNAIRNHIIESKPDIVGITAMFTAYAQDAYDVARIVKEVNPKIQVIFGGAHASANYDLVLKDENVDLVVKGEGEFTFLEIIRAIEKDEDPRRIAGTIVKCKGELYHNPERAYIENLDAIPFPARHLLPMDTYLNYSSPYCMRKPAAAIISSRGCPKRCIYCSIHSIWGYKWRARSASNVVDEIEFLVKKYGVREIYFNDDNISIDKRRMHQICDEIIKRKIDIKWTTPNGIALWTLDEALIEKMKESGCYRLTFGIESGNPWIQRFIGKNLDLDRARSVIRYANKIGLWTICTYIIGFPNETEKEISDTIRYALYSGTDFALFYLLTPFRGTAVYETFKKEGLLHKNVEKNGDFFITERACDTRYFTQEELEKINTEAYRKFMFNRLIKFLLNPFQILRKIHSWEDFRYVIRLAKTFIAINVNLVRFKQMGAKVFYGSKATEGNKE